MGPFSSIFVFVSLSLCPCALTLEHCFCITCLHVNAHCYTHTHTHTWLSLFWFKTELFCCPIVSAWTCTVLGPEASVSQPSKSTTSPYHLIQYTPECLCVYSHSSKQSFTQHRHRKNFKTWNSAWGGHFFGYILGINKMYTVDHLTKGWQINELEKALLQFISTKGIVITAHHSGTTCTASGLGLNSSRCFYAVSNSFCHLLSHPTISRNKN